MSDKFTSYLVVIIAVIGCVGAHSVVQRNKFIRSRLPYLASKRIVGGFVIDITEAPYQVSLQYDKEHNCGGSVLSTKWILTAAHCIHHESSSELTVRVGSSEHSSGGTVIRVTRVVSHPHHSSSSNNYDIALLELESELTFNSKIQPVVLPEQNEPVVDGLMGTVSGWGLTLNEMESDNLLRATNVPTVNQQECNKAYQSYGGITGQMFCAGYKHGGQDTCRQDSGGPFIAEGKQIGVISWGHECAVAGYPGVYTRVASVRDWIREISGV